MKVLISLLGLSPSVVSGAYYAFYNGWGIDKPVQLDKVITLGTSAKGISRYEDRINDELARWCSSKKIQVQYDDTCRLHIKNDDLRSDLDVKDFQQNMISLLKRHKNDEVYLVVAGGRKSMAALAALDVQLFGNSVRGLYHLYIEKELEEYAKNFWSISEDQREKVMHPLEGQCYLVEIPFIFLQENGELSFRGEVDADLAEALRARYNRLDECGREKYWDYIFEVKTADYIRVHRKYSNSIPNCRHPKLPIKYKELDVYAKSSNKGRLVVECKLRHIKDPDRNPIIPEEVEQVICKREALHKILMPEFEKNGKELKLEGWVVCNANTVTPEAWERAQEADIQLLWAELPRNWRQGPQNWQIARLTPIAPPGS